MYATGSLDGMTESQVSTNPTDPNSSDSNPTAANINSAPQITLADGEPVIFYLGDSSTVTDWESYIIKATGGAGGWSQSQVFVPEESLPEYKTYGNDAGVSVFTPLDPDETIGWVEISDYAPAWRTSAGEVTYLTEYASIFDTEDLQFLYDSDGARHAFFRTADEDARFMVQVDIDNGTATQYPVRDGAADNYAPVAFDGAGQPWFVYRTVGARYLTTEHDGTMAEWELSKSGAHCGSGSAGIIGTTFFHVTCNKADRLYITTVDLEAL